MTSQIVESKDLTLENLFASFYNVPSYQREYVWQEENISQFLDDLVSEFNIDKGLSSQYFIGSLVVLSKDNNFELIDGQQRMTTIFLAFCSIRDHLKDLGDEGIKHLDTKIASSDIDENGENVDKYRVNLQYEDAKDVLKQIADGKYLQENPQSLTRSIENILNAYKIIKSFLQKEFSNDVAKIKQFYVFFTKRVKVIRIETQSISHALRVFETINDRGVGLDSMDLLKNLLFMKAKQGDFEELKTLWKELIDTLFLKKEKPLRFLRYWIFHNLTLSA